VRRIDDLIAQHCPSGVEFKTLGEVLRIKNGKDHKPLGDGNIPVYGSGGIIRYVDTAAAEGPSVLIPRKGSLGNIFYVEGPFWVVDTIFRTEIDLSQVEPKFVYHQLLTMKLGEMNQAGGVPSQTQTVLNSLRIPVPPLEVQREIVRVLDQFTQLEAELEAELEARRLQYEHYQRALLAVGSSVENVPMGEIAAIGTGRTDRKDATVDGAFPLYVRSKDVLASDRWEFDETAIIIPGEGGIGEIFHFAAGKYALHQRAYRVAPHDTRIFPRFLYFYLRENFGDYVRQRAVTATVTSLRRSMLTDFPVPLLPLEEQTRVVETLDQFDALINDIRVGLPAELAARRKQYEYYRDKLLTFTEAA